MQSNIPSCWKSLGRRTKNDIERDDAGAWIIQRLEELVEITASNGIAKKLMRNRAVQWWDQQVKEAIKVNKEKATRKTCIEFNHDRMGGIL